MSNALLSDVEARAERRRTRTRDDMWQDLATQSWRHSQSTADPAENRRWLERAHRMMPKDGMVALALAAARLRDNDLDDAASLFQSIATTHGTADAWAGLATCAHLLRRPVLARSALAAALRASVLTPTLRALAAAIAGPAGWCGLSPEHTLEHGPIRPTRKPPANWRSAPTLHIDGPQGPMLGSPLPIRALTATEGFVEATKAGLSGWAWHPADPARDPILHIAGSRGTLQLHATEPAENINRDSPLARPRRFALTASEAAALGETLSIRDSQGRNLLGSPLDPAIETRQNQAFTPIWADIVGPTPTPAKTRPPVDIVIPIYRGETETLACIASVLASVPPTTRIIVVDDASPDPALLAALEALAAQKRIRLISLPENRGFPGAANAGIRAAPRRDIVLLNSDTLTPPGWLDRLRTAAYSAPDIGTVTPLTNDGTILSYPDPAGGNPPPGLPATIALDALAQRAKPAQTTVDIPVGVGFCLYIRRDCLDQTGLLREDLFAQGYGEENDFCLRARHRGWRNVAAPGVFVAHVGATSFGAARAHLIRRNSAILERLHPGYPDLLAAHERLDPLHPARHRMDLLRWAKARSKAGAVVMVTHGGGGGVDRVVLDRAAAIAATGQRPILLRPHRFPSGQPGIRLQHPAGPTFPNLIFPMPDGLPGLVKLLRADRPTAVELHHFLGHHHAIASLPTRLGVPQISVIHDYARFCPRIALVSRDRRYCGEPDLSGCEACIADLGSLLEDDPPIPTLLARSAAELAAATTIIAPSPDAATRIARHFPGATPTVEPWEDDRRLPPLSPPPESARTRIAVIGAIGVEKGFEVLIACVRDARDRNLPLDFVVVGFTADDERLMAAGPVFVTGEYKEDAALDLIRGQGAHMALIPSVWPETWCFALSRAWQAGLPAAVFDLGAQAERVRATGRGWVLPLGLSARALNDALLRLAPKPVASQCPPPLR